MIHAFNERGLAALDPRWAGGRPRQISDDDIAFIVTTATTRPTVLGAPFTQWSVRKLAARLGEYGHDRRVQIGRERLRPGISSRGNTGAVDLGLSLSPAFRVLATWSGNNMHLVEEARQHYDVSGRPRPA